MWCACGHLTVASAFSANPRLVVPAPWWHFVLGFLGALLVPAFRRDPWLALPALLSTIPWWPVTVSSVALIWTGPLAWAPIALATGAALLGATPRAAAMPAAPAASPRSAAWLAAGVTALVTIAAAWSASPRVPGGDEPHYLAIAQSLLRDHDLRIENNHHDPDFVAAFGDLKPDFIARGRDGEIYSIHAPGVAALVAPAFAVAGYRGAQATIIGFTAWAGGLIWLIGWRTTRSTRAAWFAWAAIAGSVTFLLQGFMVFPDAPGAFAVAVGVWLIVRLTETDDPVAPSVLAAASVAIAALPWLHTRFSVLAAGLGLVVAWLIVADASRPMADRLRRLGAFAAVPAIAAAGWFGYFQVIYGTPNPAVPYGDTSGPDGTHLAYAPGGLTGLFFDEQFGLFVYAPVLVVGVDWPREAQERSRRARGTGRGWRRRALPRGRRDVLDVVGGRAGDAGAARDGDAARACGAPGALLERAGRSPRGPDARARHRPRTLVHRHRRRSRGARLERPRLRSALAAMARARRQPPARLAVVLLAARSWQGAVRAAVPVARPALADRRLARLDPDREAPAPGTTCR